MRLRLTPGFERDVRRLHPEHRERLFTVLPNFAAAAERAAQGANSPWPRSLRVKRVVATAGIWEFTWSMRSPDGRAIWEWTVHEGEPAVLLRRVGDGPTRSDQPDT